MNERDNPTNTFVTYIDHMGSDLDVVNCARVSFDKHQDVLNEEKDAKLISYLAKHGHWSPFSHSYVKFRFHVPMFVRNQLYKHMIGLNVSEAIGEEMAWNEVSRRYVDSEPEFYNPDFWRGRAANKKQGSSDQRVDMPIAVNEKMEIMYNNLKESYMAMLEMGICPEQARMILPQNVYTTWIWTGSLVAWSRIAKQRLKEDTQYETRIAVQQIVPHMERLFPLSWRALMDE